MILDPHKLGTVLVQSELLTQDKLQAAQDAAQDRGVPLEHVLIEDEYISDSNLGQIMADQYGVPFVSLAKKSIEDATLRIVPELVARRQSAIAFARDAHGIKVALHEPDNEEFIQHLSRKTGEVVIPYFATERDISAAFRLYRKDITEEFGDIIKKSIQETERVAGDARDIPVIRIVDTVLQYAYENKASDIHIEPHERKIAVRFRIDGILHDVVMLPKQIHGSLVTRIKIQSNLRTDEHRAAQDGRLEFTAEGSKVDVRVSIVPVADGEKVVLRILSEKSRQYSLPDLGLEGEDFKKVQRGFHKPYGMIVVTGPTGSGKTTTLYAILKILNTRQVNISTIEDPVEYDMEGVNQIQANPKTNLTFANGLRSILRQDPDIIMVGEIRDEDTAGIAINAAMTGHLVLTTLHANDAPTTLPRLIDMKIEPFMIASTVNAVIAQRLVRRIHQGCMESYEPSAEDRAGIVAAIGNDRAKKFGIDRPGVRLYRGAGCKLCSNTGYEGRVGIFEVLEMSEAVRRLVMQRSNSDDVRAAAIANGMQTMLEDGIQKALRGVTSIEEILRATRE
ncbi:MAG: ATPase, T2SS/T4P/T4SS family [Patescibacteria group bacterium]|nr:ATPase, T2SS/T4P/T4SS family [Patescibacteria group bacterium]MDD5715628.1 ATPase, T2SS/T4P/T4SS family [Patescibacteria group bacterium]